MISVIVLVSFQTKKIYYLVLVNHLNINFSYYLVFCYKFLLYLLLNQFILSGNQCETMRITSDQSICSKSVVYVKRNFVLLNDNQSCLSDERSNGCETTSQVPQLVDNQETNHSQDGDIDVQGDVHFNASILERPDPASSTSAVISRPTTNCSTSANWTRSTSILGRGTTNMELSACWH